MPTKGGPAAIAGFEYQLWFTATKISDVFFDDKIAVEPEATVVREPIEEGGLMSFKYTPTSIDDIVVFRDDQVTFYNLKYVAPGLTSWTVVALVREGVLASLWSQHKKSKNAKLVFVSESPCSLLQRVFVQASEASSPKDLKYRLTSKRSWDQWSRAMKALGVTCSELIELARSVRFQLCISPEDMRESIRRNFFERVTNDSFVADVLYRFATTSARDSKRVTQASLIEYLRENKIYLKSIHADEDIVKQFITASSVLAHWKQDFGPNTSTHIRRRETDSLIDWIKKPLKAGGGPILLLVGSAGCGKTVILRDVVDSIQQEQIPCLALKADIHSGTSLTELSQILNLPDTIDRLIGSLSESHSTVVLLIDQIDALSQSLSVNRQPLRIYFNLIQRLLSMPNIRIIVSCREFDLHFDPLLRQFETNEIQRVGSLSDVELDFVLKKVGIEPSSIHPSLRSLLRTPIHLDIFCTICSPDLKLLSLNTLQDLYNELWKQKILARQAMDERAALLDAVHALSDKMYASQKLSVTIDQFADGWPKAIGYLQSESLIFVTGRLVQFFHQSFFDYVFARSFVASGKGISKELLSHHQGLFVRSQVKQVVAYLRATDHASYILELKRLLTSKRTRYHIKLMLINQLGFEQNPSDAEWQLVNETILTDSVSVLRFIESIRAGDWLRRLIDCGLLLDYMTDTREDIFGRCEWMLTTVVQTEPDAVLDFVLRMPLADSRDRVIWNVLNNLRDWQNPTAQNLFQEVEARIPEEMKSARGHILQNGLATNPNWVADYLLSHTLKGINSLSQDEIGRPEYIDSKLNQVFAELYENHPNLVLHCGIPIVTALAVKTKTQGPGEFRSDWAFFGRGGNDLVFLHWQLYEMVSEQMQKLAKKDVKGYKKLTREMASSNSLAVMNLVVRGYLVSPSDFIEDAYRLLTRPELLKNHTLDPWFGYDTRRLISAIYPLLTDEQRFSLNSLILAAEPEGERKKEARWWRGRNRFLLLGAIPEQHRKSQAPLQKIFLELERKFGKYEDAKPAQSKGGAVGAPLPSGAYRFMTPKQWLQSFQEYDESTGWDAKNHFQNKRGFPFGGLVEHSRAFEASVKEEPEKFYPFVLRLLDEPVAASYFAHGLSGLVEGGFDSARLRDLVKGTMKKNPDAEVRRTIIKAIEYLDKQNALDVELIDILGNMATMDPDPEKELWNPTNTGGVTYHLGDPLNAGINSIRGFAVWTLVLAGRRSEFTQKVFEHLDQVSNDKSVAVRCCAVVHLAHLIRNDRERTLHILLKLTDGLEPHVVTYGLECISYLMSEYFSIFVPHLKVAMRIQSRIGYDSVQHAVGQLLMLASVERIRRSEQLLEKAFALSEDAKAGALDFAVRHLLHPKPYVQTKAVRMCRRLLRNKSEVVQSEYARSVAIFDAKDFPRLYPFVLSYAKSGVAKRGIDSFHFFEYLMKALNSEPKKCLILLKAFIRRGKPEPGFYSDEPIKILVGAYSRLKDSKAPPRILEQSMDIFDTMLVIDEYRGQAQDVLRTADYT